MKSSMQYLTLLQQAKRECMELIYSSQKLEFELTLAAKAAEVAILAARTIQEEQKARDDFERKATEIAKKFDSIYNLLYNSVQNN